MLQCLVGLQQRVRKVLNEIDVNLVSSDDENVFVAGKLNL
jgi:hypothetical protein